MIKEIYHYEYVAYTDNLCWGCMLIKGSQSRSRTMTNRIASNAGKGAYIIRKIKVAGA